jgi:ribose-phosphate pyrophosphokinase
MSPPSAPSFDLLSGTAHAALGDAIARQLGATPLPRSIERTPDGELIVRVDETARGRDVAIVQPTFAPVGEHLLELLLLADACWRLGVAGITAIVPYLGYARQDRRSRASEALGSSVFASALASAPLERVLVVDPHNAAVEGGFSCPVENLTAVPLLARALERHVTGDCVIVAPDLGAAKLAQHYGQLQKRPVAIVHKQRLTPSEVVAERVIGEVRGRQPVLVDDMISTGATIAAAIELLLAQGAKPPAVVVATHGLFAPPAAERLRALPIAKLLTTDSVPGPAQAPSVHEFVSIAPLLAHALESGRRYSRP